MHREALTAVRLDNALAHYYDEVASGLTELGHTADRSGFSPGFALPTLDHRLRSFLGASELSWHPLGDHGGVPLSLLDLRANPATRTTKTFASLLIVARAVAHLRATGERIVIVTPSSANKATALRDAVLRAVESGLVEPADLQVVCVVPEVARPKLWTSRLYRDPELRRRNPVLTLGAGHAGGVKALVQELADTTDRLAGARLWFTLHLDNYRTADVVRAFFELDRLPPARRVHAHAVSSAFGLLGHAEGHARRGSPTPRPGYLLVQHLDTPDMVLDLHHDSFDAAGAPAYTFDPAQNLFRQDDDPHFPRLTERPDEVLDPTFYTRAPATSPAMKALIRRDGGGGIVVSRHECLQRYPAIRERLADTGVDLPADPASLREWSLVMVMTGVLNAIDRGLVEAGTEIMVHASGTYTSADFDPLPEVHPVETATDLAERVTAAAG